MKKILLCFLIALMVSSCGTEEYYYTADTFEISYTVEQNPARPNHWELYDGEDGLYYFCEFKEPALDWEMYANGSFVGYIVKNLSVGETLTPLPYTEYGMASDGYRWSEQYTCEFRQGYITFIYRVNDFDMSFVPEGAVFAVKYQYNP